jgi:hypothetical protein
MAGLIFIISTLLGTHLNSIDLLNAIWKKVYEKWPSLSAKMIKKILEDFFCLKIVHN